MKIRQLLNEYPQYKPPKRPNSHLRFKDKKWWLRDITQHHNDGHGGSFQLLKDQDDNVYCTDSKRHTMYGFWKNGEKYGMSFVKSRLFAPYSHNKKLKIITTKEL